MNISSKSIFSLAICTITLLSCSKDYRPTAINITNNSKSILNDVVVSGTDFSVQIGKVSINEKKSISVRPSGESSVTVNFNVAGKNYSSGKQGYFEPGYRSMNVQIAPDFTVKVENGKI
ncbi:hypothetical protein DSM106972_096480 [Dulcicalothrix desertica PCC 7102]|uniref:Uncharacterized protein n=1 Tax=Dulcicalothrix desertica PCC 7102 TaxID=232991 RepID=A0A433UHI1_9CYAN|nr:hypothetical protein [Dulcicalothrix desertica]RUS93292.1 hypothetical protein DSM106972_096480 [Dulcicalothrix desertica PCC 7102]TWH62751.1 hypothetical protein CAL7102_00274 [Dulcicalothrix desertica PCC 7102]